MDWAHTILDFYVVISTLGRPHAQPTPTVPRRIVGGGDGRAGGVRMGERKVLGSRLSGAANHELLQADRNTCPGEKGKPSERSVRMGERKSYAKFANYPRGALASLHRDRPGDLERPFPFSVGHVFLSFLAQPSASFSRHAWVGRVEVPGSGTESVGIV